MSVMQDVCTHLYVRITAYACTRRDNINAFINGCVSAYYIHDCRPSLFSHLLHTQTNTHMQKEKVFSSIENSAFKISSGNIPTKAQEMESSSEGKLPWTHFPPENHSFPSVWKSRKRERGRGSETERAPFKYKATNAILQRNTISQLINGQMSGCQWKGSDISARH